MLWGGVCCLLVCYHQPGDGREEGRGYSPVEHPANTSETRNKTVVPPANGETNRPRSSCGSWSDLQGSPITHFTGSPGVAVVVKLPEAAGRCPCWTYVFMFGRTAVGHPEWRIRSRRRRCWRRSAGASTCKRTHARDGREEDKVGKVTGMLMSQESLTAQISCSTFSAPVHPCALTRWRRDRPTGSL